ncbi:hypothetical protein Patl1_14984 [Pistacia atlantica]|uniref:Uncharacterized protein n=1 Tax=Pistacia atlantica TaxID=434234 RepID=A0ACC1B9X1_9ROSI|nr:hypothetical protein Patl1_14984 [Pistacia atlantica]
MEEEGKKKVMVAIDESDCSHYALKWALETLAPDLITSMQENQKKAAIALLNRAKEICIQHGKLGNPKEVICATAEKLNVQLLIVGSHSRGAIKRAFLGSVSNYCVHNAKCPVLVVRKPT